MNKRQKKKRILYYWELAGCPDVKRWIGGLPIFYDESCPYCGFDVSCCDDEDVQELGGKRKYLNSHYSFDGHYSGHRWTEEIKCPICKTKYEVDNSDI